VGPSVAAWLYSVANATPLQCFVAAQSVDRDKLRAAIRRMANEYIFHMLDDTISPLPEANLSAS
jgi:hypothetical protein